MLPPAWVEKTKKINGTREIKRGNRIMDRWSNTGVVVSVNVPDHPSLEDHGSISVWQDSRTNFGDDNCEHYAWLNWQDILRIIED